MKENSIIHAKERFLEVIKKIKRNKNFTFLLFSGCILFSFYKPINMLIPAIVSFFYFLEKYKSIHLLYKYVFIFSILYFLTFIYKISFIEKYNFDFEYNRIIASWSFFITLTYAVYVSYKYLKFSFPKILFSYFSLLSLFVLGSIYVFYITKQLNQQYKSYDFNDLAVYYVKIFSPLFFGAGIMYVVASVLIPYKTLLKFLISYVSIAYTTAFVFSFVLMYIAFSGYKLLFETFPLNIISWTMFGLSTQTSFFLAFAVCIWGILGSFLLNHVTLSVKMYVTAYLLVLFGISVINLSEIFYPFNILCFN